MPNQGAPTAEVAIQPELGLVQRQREANEQLVLATLRARDEADSARDAQRSAELLAAALQQRADELQSIAEFRERLIGIVGHDLRNPLNTMLLASGLLLGQASLTELEARLVNRIVDSGGRMARMITQVLEFTRANLGGGFSLALAATNLDDVCRDIADELGLATSVPIELTVCGDVSGRWDGDRLAAVMSNLAGNAAEHAEAGTAATIALRDDGATVVAEITNRGACIPAHLLPEMFLPFRSGAAAQPPAGHMGLGLYISSEVVRAHGGTLEVRSTDRTTTFTVRLPRVPATC